MLGYKDNSYYYLFEQNKNNVSYTVFNCCFHPILFGELEEIEDIDKFFYHEGIIEEISQIPVSFIENGMHEMLLMENNIH